MVTEFLQTGRNYMLAELENLFIAFGMQKRCKAFLSVLNVWLEHEGENIDIDIKLKKGGGHHFRNLTANEWITLRRHYLRFVSWTKAA